MNDIHEDQAYYLVICCRIDIANAYTQNNIEIQACDDV